MITGATQLASVYNFPRLQCPFFLKPLVGVILLVEGAKKYGEINFSHRNTVLLRYVTKGFGAKILLGKSCEMAGLTNYPGVWFVIHSFCMVILLRIELHGWNTTLIITWVVIVEKREAVLGNSLHVITKHCWANSGMSKIKVENWNHVLSYWKSRLFCLYFHFALVFVNYQEIHEIHSHPHFSNKVLGYWKSRLFWLYFH